MPMKLITASSGGFAFCGKSNSNCGGSSEKCGTGSLTGRYAHEELVERADMVTEMKKIKHHFDKGIRARIGIEF
jgi:cob(I)yrinic acid a,c-diamide adenosyltransferase (EC 2.5.1.17)